MRRRRLNENIRANKALRDLFGGRLAELSSWGQEVPDVYFMRFITIMDWPDVRIDFNSTGKIEGFELIHNYTDDNIDPAKFARNITLFTKALDEISDFISSRDFNDAVAEVIELAN